MLGNQKTDANLHDKQNIIQKLRTEQHKIKNESTDLREKKNKLMSKYINEQKRWKNKVREMQKQIANLKTMIKTLEIHSIILIAIFAVTITFSLVSLIILTPLSVIGIAIKATHLMWGLGVGSGILGIGVGAASIKSTISLNRKKEELELVNFEKERFNYLIQKRNEITIFLNYDRLCELNIIDRSRAEHLAIIQSDFWNHPIFPSHLEELELAEQYEKNGLMIPKELREKIQQNFANL